MSRSVKRLHEGSRGCILEVISLFFSQWAYYCRYASEDSLCCQKYGSVEEYDVEGDSDLSKWELKAHGVHTARRFQRDVLGSKAGGHTISVAEDMPIDQAISSPRRKRTHRELTCRKFSYLHRRLLGSGIVLVIWINDFMHLFSLLPIRLFQFIMQPPYSGIIIYPY